MLVDYDVSVSPYHAKFELDYSRLARRLQEDKAFLHQICAQGLADGNPNIRAHYQMAVKTLDVAFHRNVNVLQEFLAYEILKERTARKQAKKARKALAADKKAKRASHFGYLAGMKNLRREFYVEKGRANANIRVIQWLGSTPQLMERHFDQFRHVYMDFEDWA